MQPSTVEGVGVDAMCQTRTRHDIGGETSGTVQGCRHEILASHRASKRDFGLSLRGSVPHRAASRQERAEDKSGLRGRGVHAPVITEGPQPLPRARVIRQEPEQLTGEWRGLVHLCPDHEQPTARATCTASGDQPTPMSASCDARGDGIAR